MRRLRRQPERGPSRDGTPAPWALLSLLLRYPDSRLTAVRAQVPGEVAALASGRVREALERFLDASPSSLDEQAARYVETFDLTRRCSLYLTYYSHGDTRQRGMALLRIKKLYRAAGLPLDGPELPDHLAVMLAFAALAPPGHGEALLREHRPAIELLRRALHDRRSPYAHLLDAVGAALGELSLDDRQAVAKLLRDGPPDEAVGLEPYAPGDVMPAGARP